MDAPIAEITSYEGLLDCLRRRMVELGATFERLDETAGFTRGYTQRILSMTSPSKCLGSLSFAVILQTLGLKLHVVEDAEQLARVRHRLISHHQHHPSGPHHAWCTRVLAAGCQTPASTQDSPAAISESLQA
jgi:hypothetical protein